MDQDFLDDQDLEGDVLLLDPDKPGKRVVGNIGFERQIGRGDDRPDLADADNHAELVIEPNIDVIRKRVPFLANFEKQKGREETKHVDDDDVYVDNNEYADPYPNDPSQYKP